MLMFLSLSRLRLHDAYVPDASKAFEGLCGSPPRRPHRQRHPPRGAGVLRLRRGIHIPRRLSQTTPVAEYREESSARFFKDGT